MQAAQKPAVDQRLMADLEAWMRLQRHKLASVTKAAKHFGRPYLEIETVVEASVRMGLCTIEGEVWIYFD
jgi:hypothetical protein